MRTIHSLNNGWQFLQDATLETLAAAEKESISLPHTWSSNDNARRGTCWYTRELPRPHMKEGERVWLQCDGAAMTAEIYLNGERLARHEGGYSAFRVDLTDRLAENNVLAVSVDNSVNQTVYPQSADFTFYGGLYRDVMLIVVPAVHFALGYCGNPGIRVTPVVDLAAKSAAVTVEAWVDGEADEVIFTVAGQTVAAPVENGHAAAAVIIENVRLWDGVDDPYLYSASAALASGDEVSARFGCRQIAIDQQKGFLLNGHSYPLRGVACHQDYADIGSALTMEHHQTNMDIVKELGANTLRLAHYQHAQAFYDLCDENGIVVWAEIPYISRHMPQGRANTLSQMEDLIVQNYNHPCIAVWGLSNEVSVSSAVDEDVLENHRLLNDLCHRLDPTRPTTMASVGTLEIGSPLLSIPDVNSYNLYFGWYAGEAWQTGEFLDTYHTSFPERPIGLSEYGADANPRYQSAHPERGDYTESYQMLYHEQLLQIIESRPWLWATHVWNLFDFGADGRDEGGKHAQNQKGLVTYDRQVKKDAFYLYKAAWNKKEPFVHLCGKRYEQRTEDVTEIKAYSNQAEVTLYVDGQPVETKVCKTVFTFRVPITGIHTIEVKAGACSDSMQLRKVSEPNPDYRYDRMKDIVNWFDQGPIDPAFYSIGDTIAVLLENPEAAKVTAKLLVKMCGIQEQAGAAGVDLLDPAMLNMIGRLTLPNLRKHTGDLISDEDIQQVNRVLQTIKKDEA